jgi:hypothetical protein
LHRPQADVEADARNADLLLVGDDAADRLRITEVPIRADHARDNVADAHAIAHLRARVPDTLVIRTRSEDVVWLSGVRGAAQEPRGISAGSASAGIDDIKNRLPPAATLRGQGVAADDW